MNDPVSIAAANTAAYINDGWNIIEETEVGVGTAVYTWGKDLFGTLEGAGGIGGCLPCPDVHRHK